MTPPLIVRPLRAWVHYHVLSHLDLGADAANIFRAEARSAWVAGLLDAYQNASDRLRVQHTPMTEKGSQDDRLRTGLQAARDAVWPAVEVAWQRDEPQDRHERFYLEVAPALQACRAAANGAAPPPLIVWDVPALGRHGRAAQVNGNRVVATSLAEPSEHVFCQVLHEEMHPVTDPLVAEMFEGVDMRTRDTHIDGAGYALHRALEVAAVEGGRQIIEQVAPRFAPAYARWCAVHGM